MQAQNLSSDPSPPQLEGRAPETVPPTQISIVELVSGLLRHRYLIVRTALLCAVLVAVVNAILPASYSAFAALMPQTPRPSSALSGIATQFGISLPASDPGQTPAFYLDLVNSTQLLSSLATSKFPSREAGGAQRPLMDILQVEGATSAARVNDAVLLLRRRIKGSIRPKTGVVDVVVKTNDPNLSAAICARLLELLDRFNLENRQSQAAAEARFVEGRLGDAKAELRVAEDRLQLFLERNRLFRTSSELSFQEERLRRDVTLNQQIVTTLSQNYEQARIDQVRDTPAITVVERPVPPAEADRKHHLRHAGIGAVVGLVLGMIWAWLRELLQGLRRRRDPEVAEFEWLIAESGDELRHPWRFVSRVLVPRARK